MYLSDYIKLSAQLKLKQNSFKAVLKLFCFSFISIVRTVLVAADVASRKHELIVPRHKLYSAHGLSVSQSRRSGILWQIYLQDLAL